MPECQPSGCINKSGDSNARVPLPTSVEDVTGEANIANLWRTHYKDLFNNADEGCRAANYAVCNDVYSDIQVSCDELSSAIDYLDINKSCGLDGIYAEHLKFGSYLLAKPSQPMYVQFL